MHIDHALVFMKGGRYASEFACKNYLILLADILNIKEPSHNALKLVCIRPLQGVCVYGSPLLQQVVKSLSEMCGTSSLTQDLARYSSAIGMQYIICAHIDAQSPVNYSADN